MTPSFSGRLFSIYTSLHGNYSIKTKFLVVTSVTIWEVTTGIVNNAVCCIHLCIQQNPKHPSSIRKHKIISSLKWLLAIRHLKRDTVLMGVKLCLLFFNIRFLVLISDQFWEFSIH